MENYELRAKAREALAGQWGINAIITLFVYIITTVIQGAVTRLFGFNATNSDGLLYLLVTYALSIFILFAFSYGQNYIALEVAKGQKAEIGDVFSIFNKKYYVPMMIFNLISEVLNFLISLIIFVPIMLIFGFTAYMSFALGGSTNGLTRLLNDGEISTSTAIIFVVLILAVLVLFFIVSYIIAGVFKFAAWAKLENPEMPTLKALTYAWYLIKDRIGKYILLNLSFIGWWIFCIFIIPVLWVVPYINTSLAEFYLNAKNERDFMNV